MKKLIITSLVLIAFVACQREPNKIIIKTTDPDNIVYVPHSDCNPVMTDGWLNDNEWGDAYNYKLNDTTTFYVKQDDGYFYIGITYPYIPYPAINLYFSDNTGGITQFHISAQISEKKLSPSDPAEDEEWQWGYSKDWYANEFRWDQNKVQQKVQQTGENWQDLMSEFAYGSGGGEFMISKSKFSVNELKFSFGLVTAPDWDTATIFPTGTTPRDVSTYTTLKFD